MSATPYKTKSAHLLAQLRQLIMAITVLVSSGIDAIAAEPLLHTVDGLAIAGYDPVSYQLANGPVEGSEKITAVQDGATYRFANDENRKTFVADAKRYQPQFGGWCAYAMADGEFVDVDPKTFKVIDQKLFLFYNGWLGNTLKKWNKNEVELRTKAEKSWKRIVSERVGK